MMKNTKKELEEILTALSGTISNCDAKAAALLSAVGIVFGFSMFSVSEIQSKDLNIRIWIYVVGSLYLLAFMATIVLLTLTIFPRRRTAKEKQRKVEYNRYHEDLFQHLESNDLDEFVKKEATDDAIIDQIKNCSRIAHVKENFLRASAVFIAIFSLLLIGVVILLVI